MTLPDVLLGIGIGLVLAGSWFVAGGGGLLIVIGVLLMMSGIARETGKP